MQIEDAIKTWNMLNEGQQEQARIIWDILDGDAEAKVRWLREPDGDGFTRLARIVMGEAGAVRGEAEHLAFV